MISRYNYADATPAQQAAPIERAYAQPGQAVQQAYAQPSPAVVIVQAPAQAPTIIQQPAPVVVQQPPVYYGYPPAPGGLRLSSGGLWISANRISGLLPALLRKRRCPMFFCKLWALPGACGLAGRAHNSLCLFAVKRSSILWAVEFGDHCVADDG